MPIPLRPTLERDMGCWTALNMRVRHHINCASQNIVQGVLPVPNMAVSKTERPFTGALVIVVRIIVHFCLFLGPLIFANCHIGSCLLWLPGSALGPIPTEWQAVAWKRWARRQGFPEPPPGGPPPRLTLRPMQQPIPQTVQILGC